MTIAHAMRVLRNHPRPMRLVAARLLQWSGLSQLFRITLDDYQLRFYPTNTSANLWIDPNSRFHDLSLFKDYCQPGDLVVDVGANIGEVSIVLSQRVGASGQVLAFEPQPRIYRYLRGNLSLNGCGNVIATNAAVGAAPGTVRMSDSKRDDMNRVVDDGAIEVPCTTLDAALPANAIALLKIDVEGTELRVLEGARQTLTRTACVNCESSEEHYQRYGYGIADVIAFLQSAGFTTHVIDGARALRAIDETFSAPGVHEIVARKEPLEFARRTGWRLS
jgi:FkbM family methyltransferase